MIRLACSTLSAEGFENSFFEKTFEMIPVAGFRFLEINMWFPELLEEAAVSSFKERSRKRQLKPISVLASGFGEDPGSPKEFQEALDYKIKAMRYTADLGCGLYLGTGAGRGKKGGINGVIAQLRELLPAAKELGLRIGLENHQGNNLEFVEDYLEIFEQIDDPALGAVCDNGHFDASGIPMRRIIDEIGEKVIHLHVKENNGFGKKAFVRFGEGTTDHSQMINGFLQMGYDGYMSVELSPPADRPSSIADLNKAYEMFTAYEGVEG